MKKLFRNSLVFLLFYSFCNAQVVDKSINGIQTGALGIWWYNESKITKNWAFRTEIGYEAPFYDRTLYWSDVKGNYKYYYPVFQPVISIEPRLYYNSRKRQGNSKNTFHNSGNFFSFPIKYYPKIWAYSPKGNTSESEAFGPNDPNGGVFLIPTWGIRRNINYRWNFELGVGFGVDLIEAFDLGTRTLKESSGSDFIYNIHLRIGYKYGMKE